MSEQNTKHTWLVDGTSASKMNYTRSKEKVVPGRPGKWDVGGFSAVDLPGNIYDWMEEFDKESRVRQFSNFMEEWISHPG